MVTPDGRSKLRFQESLWEVQEFQRDEGDELLTVKRLNGDVKKQGELAFAGGTSCEVWVGRWEKHGKGIGREGEDVEKVSLNFTLSAPLIPLFAGRLESASNIPVTKEGARGLAFVNLTYIACSSPFPVARNSNANCQLGQSWTTKISCRCMVCVFPGLLPRNVLHGCLGIVTDLGPRLYMVSGLLHARNYADSSSSGITMAGERRPTSLRQNEPRRK